MIAPELTGAQIRQMFIDFFIHRRHTFVPSSPLVPGNDPTLLFTNAGMVQFKDVFLGTDRRPYNRAANSQKCLRVAGKHNDLEDVGRDDYHHTFFEMLGNWSFGDYYKKEAIAWAWELLTETWGLPKDGLYATCFQDEKGEIERDDEAAGNWSLQPGLNPDHILFFGRKENFWEMAETGPCGPCSEIHFDRGPEFCDKRDIVGHVCGVNQGCARFLELWNLVFIQYNRTGPSTLEPLPSKHVDTGMGLERIVAVLQGKASNYKTDLFYPLMATIQSMSGDSNEEREANLTPYRVICDHTRAAVFLIADGVVPGNTGRNYVCRMIIRRAARFGTKIGLDQPFLAQVAETVIDQYGEFYPELVRNRVAILDSLTREEKRFQRTVESGVAKLEVLLSRLRAAGERLLPGEQAFDLYATYGLPLEITRDIAREQDLDVDDEGFRQAMEAHRLASGSAEAFGTLGGDDVDIYRRLLTSLQAAGRLGPQGVVNDPYERLEVQGPVLALIRSGESVTRAESGDRIEVILPETCFYVESGGQVSDTGVISSSMSVKESQQPWEIRVEDVRRPAAGVTVHIGQVTTGYPQTGDIAIARVDAKRRQDIKRNHTATHLLHAELRAELGGHARQAGSLVAPDRLRFDFTHPEALTTLQLERIEAGVNRKILDNYPLRISIKPMQQAITEGAMALFGEKYGETVRTISIGDETPNNGGDGRALPFSYELCGGTHVDKTGDIGMFIITAEGSVAAGVRRIEALTGSGAYDLIQRRMRALKETAGLLATSPEEVPIKTKSMLKELEGNNRQIAGLRRDMALIEFGRMVEKVPLVSGVPVLATSLPGADAETMRQMSDRFRQRHPSGVAVLASVIDGRPILVAAVSEDLVSRGLHAGELVKNVAGTLGGGGGGKPTMAQAGGKDASRLEEALASVPRYVEQNLK